MRYRSSLIIAVAGLLMSGSSCNAPIVRHSPPPPPAICLEDCKPYLSALPLEDDAVGRKLWELDAIWDYKACADIKKDCREVLENNGQK